MTRRRSDRIVLLASAIAAMLLAPVALIGQERLQPIPIDSRIRVTRAAAPDHSLVGTLGTWDGESLGLVNPGLQPQTIRLSELARLEISRGRRGNAKTGMWIGALVGLVGGLIAANQLDEPEVNFRTEGMPEGDGIRQFGIGLAGAALGTALGAGVGALIRTEKWEEVPLANEAAERAPEFRRAGQPPGGP